MAVRKEDTVEEVMDVTAKVQVKEALSSKVMHETPFSSSGTEVSNRDLGLGLVCLSF
jgi:hypothetical protein